MLIQRFLNVSVPIGSLQSFHITTAHYLSLVSYCWGASITTTVQQCVIKDTNIFLINLTVIITLHLSRQPDTSIGCCYNQSRTSSAPWPVPPHEVCESSHYQWCVCIVTKSNLERRRSCRCHCRRRFHWSLPSITKQYTPTKIRLLKVKVCIK